MPSVWLEQPLPRETNEIYATVQDTSLRKEPVTMFS